MSKAIKAYNQLPPAVKQSINNVAANAARAVVKNVAQVAQSKQRSQARSRTTRTRQGQRIYSPSTTITTDAIAPASYITRWRSGNTSLRVRQTEVIGPVTANSTWFPSWNNKYSVATFPINPANPTTFPWLSYIARLYDKYRFHSLRFIYINSVSTAQEGNIMMSLDYDTLDAAPSNLVEASQLAHYQLTPTYIPSDFRIPVNHPGNLQWLYTFDLSIPANADLKTYNLGNFFLALDGVPQDGKSYGYLAVEYDVELLDKNPVISSFSSKTYDYAGPVAKKARSNVDPADTTEVQYEITTTPIEGDAPIVHYTFTTTAPFGSHVRALVTLKATNFRMVGLYSTKGSIIDQETSYGPDDNNPTSYCTFTLDGVVDDNGVFATVDSLGPYQGDILVSTVALMAYTYA